MSVASGAVTPRERAALALWLSICGIALIAMTVRRPLWYDEIFTIYVAQAESPVAVVRALLAGADNGPPIDYLIRHGFSVVLGNSVWAMRLPSIVAFLGAQLALWSYLRRFVSREAAWSALGALCCTAALDYATEARPYALLVALAAASLLAWRVAHDSGGVRAKLMLAVALGAGPLVHYFGVLHYVPVFMAEALVVGRTRRLRPPMLGAILASLLPLMLLPVFTHHVVEMQEYFWASNYGWWTVTRSYVVLLGAAGSAMALFAVVELGWPRSGINASPRDVDRALGVGLLIAPLVVYVVAITVTNAMTYRYALVSVVGAAVLTGLGVDRFRARWPLLARILMVLWLFAGLVQVGRGVSASVPRPIEPQFLAFLDEVESVVAIESPIVFLPLYHRLQQLDPALGAKVVYLHDRSRSRSIMGFDNDEIALPRLAALTDVPTRPLQAQLESGGDWWVLRTRTRSWLVEALQGEARLTVALVHEFGELQLWRVQPSLEP